MYTYTTVYVIPKTSYNEKVTKFKMYRLERSNAGQIILRWKTALEVGRLLQIIRFDYSVTFDADLMPHETIHTTVYVIIVIFDITRIVDLRKYTDMFSMRKPV